MILISRAYYCGYTGISGDMTWNMSSPVPTSHLTTLNNLFNAPWPLSSEDVEKCKKYLLKLRRTTLVKRQSFYSTMSGHQIYISSEESANPNFWLEFRTFDDGLTPPLATSPPASPSASPPASFSQFLNLPAELRLKIWDYLIQPRIIVTCCFKRDEGLDKRRQELEQRTTRGNAVPVLLKINRESRAEGLKHYELAFRWNISKLISDTPVSKPAQVYFNFKLDALYLTGDLEAYDTYGVNSPMVYFMRREDTIRVRHVACAFKELGYPEHESDQIFGCLWHVVDRFPAVERLLLTVGEGDEDKIVVKEPLGSTDNVMQNIWHAWMSGETDTESRFMADKQMLLVRENALAEYITSNQG